MSHTAQFLLKWTLGVPNKGKKVVSHKLPLQQIIYVCLASLHDASSSYVP